MHGLGKRKYMFTLRTSFTAWPPAWFDRKKKDKALSSSRTRHGPPTTVTLHFQRVRGWSSHGLMSNNLWWLNEPLPHLKGGRRQGQSGVAGVPGKNKTESLTLGSTEHKKRGGRVLTLISCLVHTFESFPSRKYPVPAHRQNLIFHAPTPAAKMLGAYTSQYLPLSTLGNHTYKMTFHILSAWKY